MTTYRTKNPIGSTAPKDLFDNAENLDVAVNSQSADTWEDRFGKQRKTWHGIERTAAVQIGAATDAAERAKTYAEASGNIKFSDTYGKMLSMISSGNYVDGDVIEVYVDETKNHDRTRYLVSGVNPIFKLNLSKAINTDELVSKTSLTGAAILPEGTDAQRPLNPSEIPAVGLLFRGSTTSGRPEFFDRSKSGWKPIGTSAELTATESETDSTPGRAIKVGDFGIGQKMVVKQNIAGSEAFGAYYDATKSAAFVFNIPHNKDTAGFRFANIPYENRFFAQAAVAPGSQNLRPGVEFWHSGNFDANKVFGLAQTWKDITSSRTTGVVYTNASTQPICLQIIGKASSSASQIDLLINGVWVTLAEQGTVTGQTSSTIVMPGQSYRFIATPLRVMELS